jgi:hypothetical protein
MKICKEMSNNEIEQLIKALEDKKRDNENIERKKAQKAYNKSKERDCEYDYRWSHNSICNCFHIGKQTFLNNYGKDAQKTKLAYYDGYKWLYDLNKILGISDFKEIYSYEEICEEFEIDFINETVMCRYGLEEITIGRDGYAYMII